MTLDELKPAVRATLDLLRNGRIVVSIDHGAGCGYLEELDGARVRDPEFPDRKMLCPGVFTLFKAGLVDQFGCLAAKARS